MKIVCPSCTVVQEIIPDDLIGRYVRCMDCHNIFLWEKSVDRQETHRNHKFEKDSSFGKEKQLFKDSIKFSVDVPHDFLKVKV